MAQPADPLTGARFLVQIDGVAPADFLEVVLPEATIAAGREQLAHLVLRRAAGIDRELFDWWRQGAIGKPVPRRVSVVLLNLRGEAQVRWNFTGAQPVRYAVSAFNALEPAIVVETMELTVETFERG